MTGDLIDLRFRGRDRVIATGVIEGRDGLALVDPGPSSCLAALEAGLQERGHTWRDVRSVLLTHIHLDHAGAAGTIAERAPNARVFVHERGAPHMIDPSRLLASATRLYGDQMEPLWGEFLAVPAARVEVLRGGEQIEAAGRRLRVAYTPGHAQHHVSYLDELSGLAYVGDTAGIRVSGDYIIAPTPPPDIDLEAWSASLTVIEAWQPVSLLLTHFGVVSPARAHLARFRGTLTAAGEAVRATLAGAGSDDDKMRAFAEGMRRDVRGAMSEDEARATELAAPFDQLWQGLARYWRKRSA